MSIAVEQLQIGQRVTFEVYPTATLGTFREVIIDSFLSPDAARSFGVDIDALHANVYRTLPNTVPNDPNAYRYMRLIPTNGSPMIIGVPYIRPESISVVSTGVIRVRLDNMNQADYTRFLNALSANGFRASSITFTQE